MGTARIFLVLLVSPCTACCFEPIPLLLALPAPNWPYTGRKFMLLFSAPTVTPQPHQPPTPQQQPQPQPQQQQQQPQPPQQQQPPQQPPHPQHPPPPPMQQQQTPPVPGPYEDDHSRSPYMPMYPYAYQYPGQPPMQPMMQVPPTSGPPGYMQGPYMQPMPYPPHQMAPNQREHQSLLLFLDLYSNWFFDLDSDVRCTDAWYAS